MTVRLELQDLDMKGLFENLVHKSSNKNNTATVQDTAAKTTQQQKSQQHKPQSNKNHRDNAYTCTMNIDHVHAKLSCEAYGGNV